MFCRPLDQKVPGRLGRRLYLGPYARTSGLQSATGQARPVPAHFGIKSLTPVRVHHQVVWRIHPLHIGAKLGVPTQIKREVQTQTGGFGNESGERRPIFSGCTAFVPMI